MKKFFYVAAAFLAAGFVSCDNNEGPNAPTADLVPIHFNVGSGRAVIEETRGTGAVGDITGGENIWRGEELNVYMFEKGTLTLTADATGNGAPLFYNDVVVAPNADEATAMATINTQKYYPMAGESDFFAYHADDAVAGAVVEGTDAFTLPVLIDGSQDLMVSKAALTADQEAMLPAEKADKYYSAYSARKGVNPHFVFEHLLSRVTFEAKANTNAETAVSINAIEITNANTTADMVVAYVDAPAELLANQATPASVFLKEKAQGVAALQALTATNPGLDYTRIGESLMLMPQAEYEMMIHMTQNIDGEDRNVSLPYTLKAETLGLTAFEAGKQYNVKFTVYGLQEIVLELELVAWEEGGNIFVDDEN